ncbi:MAG: aminopeptidase P family protein [Acidobacteria bacterium]|nr:aminopeptidase P family protein [Acidobacteriota bacterium]
MEENRWDLFLTTDPRTTYWLTGEYREGSPPAVCVLEPAGERIIELGPPSIDHPIEYPERELASRMRVPPAARCGVERRAVPGVIEAVLPSSFDASETVLALRRRKEADEIAQIRAALEYCKIAYDAAREMIAPGVTEVDVYNAMHAAVTRKAGTAITFAGDFASGVRAIRGGGPPAGRRLEPEDLYILDLFPAPAYYFGDTCRTFAVGEPSDLQQRAWELVCEALRLAESLIRPGVPVKRVYRQVKEFLDSHEIAEKSFWHHLGHGIGHRGHEAPRIVPGSDEVFEAGDVIAIEPGVYSDALRGGIRIEDNYIVGGNGLENLFDYPKELKR